MKTPWKRHLIASPAKSMTRMSLLGNLTILMTVLTVVLLLMTCGAPDDGGGSLSPPSNGKEFSGQRVLIVGSTALLPLASKAADLFRKQHPEVVIDVKGGGSIAGLNAVSNNEADIGNSDIYADPALYPDPNLTDHIVCVNAFTLIVNPQITITSLTTQQVINIFTGATTNWKQVGGPDLPITTVIRPSTSGTRALFRKYVLGGLEETGDPLTSDSNSTVLDTVAHTPGAIGYATTVVVNSTVKAIGLDGVSATLPNIQAGKYRYWGFEHMYTLHNGIDATTAFLDFMQTPEVQQLAQTLGYMPVSAVKSQQASTQLIGG